jgi:hypothetical protein
MRLLAWCATAAAAQNIGQRRGVTCHGIKLMNTTGGSNKQSVCNEEFPAGKMQSEEIEFQQIMFLTSTVDAQKE